MSAPVAAQDESTPLPRAAPLPACCRCGTAGDLVAVRVETWEDQGYTLTNKHKYRVTRLDALCCCRRCGKALGWQRLLSDLLTALPVPIAVAAAMLSGSGEFVAVLFICIYCIYLLRWSSYTWADKVVYGFELETSFAAWIPSNPGKVRFPAGVEHGMVRMGLLLILSFAAIAVGSAFQ